MNCKIARSGMFSTKRGRGTVLAAGTLGLVLAAVSCQTVNRAVVVLPDVPGAKYIGSKECEQCHDKLYRDFATADHARLIAAGTNALNAGCESCHGPCSLHSESGGETKPPYSFTPGRPQNTSFGARVQVDPARAKESLTTIEESGQQAMGELRRLLRLLRDEGEPAGSGAPRRGDRNRRPAVPDRSGPMPQLRRAHPRPSC